MSGDDLTSAPDIAAIEKALRWHLGEHHLTNDPCGCGSCDPINHPGHKLNWSRVEAWENVKTLIWEIRIQEARVASLEAWKEKAMIALTAAQRHLALGTPAESSYIIRLGDK